MTPFRRRTRPASDANAWETGVKEDAARPRACPVLDTGVNGVQGEGLRDVKRPAHDVTQADA